MYHTMTKEEVLKNLRTSLEDGLSAAEVEKRKKLYGENKLQEKKKTSIFVKFIKQFNDFMILILIIAAVVSAVMSMIEKNNEYIDSIIIFTIVVVNAILGLIQESKAEKALEALKKMSAPNAKVRRNGKLEIVKGEELVPGDIVMLEAGDFVPADIRLLESSSLKAEESALTGETTAVLKDADVLLNPEVITGDMINACFGTTMVTNGHGIRCCDRDWHEYEGAEPLQDCCFLIKKKKLHCSKN